MSKQFYFFLLIRNNVLNLLHMPSTVPGTLMSVGGGAIINLIKSLTIAPYN